MAELEQEAVELRSKRDAFMATNQKLLLEEAQLLALRAQLEFVVRGSLGTCIPSIGSAATTSGGTVGNTSDGHKDGSVTSLDICASVNTAGVQADRQAWSGVSQQLKLWPAFLTAFTVVQMKRVMLAVQLMHVLVPLMIQAALSTASPWTTFLLTLGRPLLETSPLPRVARTKLWVLPT